MPLGRRSLVYVVRHEVAADSAPEYASLARDKAPSVQVSVVPETEVDESRPRARQLQSLEMRTSAGFLAYTEDSGTVVVDPSIVVSAAPPSCPSHNRACMHSL